eukprot:m51a1_g13217 hypothetical protein (380) ;mRNA; f:190-1329
MAGAAGVGGAARAILEALGATDDTYLRASGDKLREALAALQKWALEEQARQAAAAAAIPDSNIDDIAERELMAAAQQIEALAKQLREARAKRQASMPARAAGEIDVDDAIVEAALAISQATEMLVKAAAAAQRERVARGRAAATTAHPYQPNPVWAEGLVSAGRAVAGTTGNLVGAANRVATQGSSGEELLDETLAASAHAVAASTAQLVSATRSKSDPMSPAQERVDDAAKAVTRATALLVEAARAAGQQAAQAQRDAELEEMRKAASMGAAGLRVREMEQQVQILRLEKELGSARERLSAIRKSQYTQQQQAAGQPPQQQQAAPQPAARSLPQTPAQMQQQREQEAVAVNPWSGVSADEQAKIEEERLARSMRGKWQ